MKIKPAPFSVERARELFVYEPLTGALTWKARTPESFVNTAKRTAKHRCSQWNARFSGVKAGTLDSHGHRQIKINCVSVLAARLIWAMQTGFWPSRPVDHIDVCGDNDSWENLRLATDSLNGANRHCYHNNKLGLKGVCLDRKTGKFVAQVQAEGIKTRLGYFDCPAAAHFAYVVAADKLHGAFARAR